MKKLSLLSLTVVLALGACIDEVPLTTPDVTPALSETAAATTGNHLVVFGGTVLVLIAALLLLLFRDWRWLLIAISIIVSAVLVWWVLRRRIPGRCRWSSRAPTPRRR